MSEDTKINTTQDNVQEPQIEETTSEDIVEETVTPEEVVETTEEVTEEVTPEESEVEEEVTLVSNGKNQFGFKSGDTIRVHYKITEGNKTRIQPYEGIVIARNGKENSKTFTVRRIGADNVGVERIFPLFSPNIDKIDVVKRGKVRKSKLYYLRDKIGREAMRIKELGK